nr:cation diffusion facilitator family transporter [bacterium]
MNRVRPGAPDSKLPYLEGWGSIALNCLLFAAKYAVGLATGSVAITADAWHTLSDSVTSILVLAGVKVSRKPADAAHPFGHGRAERVASLVIGVLLAMVAVFFGGDAVHRLIDGRRAEYGAAAIWVTAASVVIKEAMARFSSWAGRKTGYTALKADAWHHRSDALSSLVILAGILFGGA